MNIRAPGRTVSVGDTCAKLNPHLFPAPITLAPSQATKPKKRIRQSSKPLLNNLEAEFAAHHYLLTRQNLIPQSIRFRLGNGIWYKPDFVSFCPTMGVTAFEIKGPHAHRGGFENLKVAAGLYKDITWRLCWKDQGEWMAQLVLP